MSGAGLRLLRFLIFEESVVITIFLWEQLFQILRRLAGNVLNGNTFTDMDGNVFTYRMVERETLPPTSVDAMESGDWDLTLFTCTMGGQSRVTIRFELEEN